MKEYIVFCALLSVLVSADAITEKWQTTADGSRYFIETDLKYNWFEAFHECAQKNMSLFVIDSLGKHEKMDRLFKNVLDTDGARLYMAGHDNAAGSNQFVWFTTGKPFAFTHWYENEPNNNHEHCAEVQPNTMKWNNVPCDTKLGYMCEESPWTTKANQELIELRSLLKAKEQDLNASKLSYESQIQELKGKIIDIDGTRKFFETLMSHLSKEKQELLTALTKCYESQKNVTVIPNKYYNIAVNPQNYGKK